jgi:hypothetical protein
MRRMLSVVTIALILAAMMVALSAPAFAGLAGKPGGGAFVTHDPCVATNPDGTSGTGFDNTVNTPSGKGNTTGCKTQTNGNHTGWVK